MVDLLTERSRLLQKEPVLLNWEEINAQIKRGDLLYVDVAKAMAHRPAGFRVVDEARKSILPYSRE